ncbi:MAG TPA: F0F1 ATP synthase subunit delta [Gemmatimonadaceae bacterium]|nr:F0F1 ATP synthase subunit delta [Gemmatimonadaceae bacterium]
MRDATIGKNYAEALLELARRADDPAGWGKLMRDVANGMQQDITVQHFLESPKISEAQKNEVFFQALGDRVPRHFLRFLQTLVRKRRQMLIPTISEEYDKLLDVHEGRVHANVTVARETSAEDETRIAQQLSRVIGKTVVPHLNVNPAILGGVVVKIGDTVMDGSVRRRLGRLKAQILSSR